MEYNFRAIYKQASNSSYSRRSSNFTYFAEQAFRSNYSHHDFVRYNPLLRNPIDVHDAMIQRQLEKERIREEIIAAEIARRRELEAEVRRELMLERELEFRRRTDEFPFRQGQQALPYSHQAEGRSLDKRIALTLEERFGGGYSSACTEFGGFEKELPFQRSAQPKISEIRPLKSEVNKEKQKEKEKEKIILLAKPDANLSGTKRKAVTPPTVGAGFLPLIGWKKPKEEWSCAICQVSATSERGLNEHLRGKRHKSKEAGLRAQRTGKNFSIGLCSKKTSNPTKPAEVTENPIFEQVEEIEGKSLQFIKDGGSPFLNICKTVSSKKNEEPILQKEEDAAENPISEQVGEIEGKSLQFIKDEGSPFLNICKTGSSKKNEAPILQKEEDGADLKKNGKAVQKMQKIPENKKKNFKFWCEMCQAGAFSEKVMNNHKKGNKHVSQLQELNKNGEAVPGTQMVRITGKANEVVIEDKKMVTPEAVGGTVDGVDVEVHQAAEVSGILQLNTATFQVNCSIIGQAE